LTNQEHLGAVLHAIADPTRRAILGELAKGPRRVTTLAEPFDMSLNAVSKHVKVLEAARLVTRMREGREHVLELRAAPLREVVQWTSQFEQFWTEKLDRIEDYFKGKRRS
jgi:DNA-binding transcriptional ArsR family regulator